MNYFFKKNKGMATLEILIAMAIMVLALSAVLPLIVSGQDGSISSQTHQEALYKAQHILEDARASLKADFNSAITPPPPTDDIYQQSLIVIQSSDGASKQITASVFWGQNQKIELSSQVVDWAGGLGICNMALTNADGWQNPKHYDFNSYDLISPITGNHTGGFGISDIKVYRQKLYLTASSAADNKNTFYIFDLPQDPSQMPAYIGSADNSSTVSAGLAAMAISGNYAYVANSYTGSSSGCTENSNCAQLQVIDISNPQSPIVVKNKKISATTSGNKLAAATSIFYDNGYIYLGLAKTSGSGSEFNIIDVGGGGAPAKATNPLILSGYTIGRGINSILVNGNYAYIAHPTTSTSNPQEQITVLDISDRAHPKRVGGWHAPDNQGNGKSFSLSSNFLLFGRTVTTTSNPEFYILDSTSPSNFSGNNPNPYGQKISDSVNGVLVRGDNNLRLAYLFSNKQFQILNITQPNNIKPFASFLLQDIINSAQAGSGNSISGSSAQTCTGNYLYTAIQTNMSNKDVLSIITP